MQFCLKFIKKIWNSRKKRKKGQRIICASHKIRVRASRNIKTAIMLFYGSPTFTTFVQHPTTPSFFSHPLNARQCIHTFRVLWGAAIVVWYNCASCKGRTGKATFFSVTPFGTDDFREKYVEKREKSFSLYLRTEIIPTFRDLFL